MLTTLKKLVSSFLCVALLAGIWVLPDTAGASVIDYYASLFDNKSISEKQSLQNRDFSFDNGIPLTENNENYLESGTPKPEEETELNVESAQKTPDIKASELTDIYQIKYTFGNGGYYVASYPQAVGYEDDGRLLLIDNTLIKTETGFSNKSNSVKVTLPVKLSGTVGLSYKDYSLSFSEIDAPEVEAEIIDVKAPDTDDERLNTILSAVKASKAVYAAGGTETVYSLCGTDLKETIILHDASVSANRTYAVKTEGLKLKLSEDGSILAIADDEEIFELPAAFMTDSDGEVSYDINTELKETEDGYIITYEPDEAWLTDPGRIYPVYIDPTIKTKQIRTNIRDKMVASNATTSNNDNYLEAGYHRTRGKERSYIKFTAIPKLTSADTVVNAALLIYRGTDGEDLQINAHKVNATWESETLTWSNKPAYQTEAITDYAMVGDTGWYEFDITAAAKDWYVSGNTGVMLKANDSVETAATHNNRTFYSSDRDDTSLRPVLIMQFMNANGLEGYFSYDDYDAGRAGTVYANTFSGNITVKRSDMSFSGLRMPVSIDFIYNNADYSETGFGLGAGWRTSLNQTVSLYTPEEGTSTGGYTYYKWIDEDGTCHYFRSTSTSGTYKDESGIDLTLKKLTSGSYTYKIIDKEGNESCFDSSGRLVRISNNEATKSYIDITYVTSGNTNRIASVTDGAGRHYYFTYGSDGYIDSIAFKGTGSTALTTVTYTVTSGKLAEVIYSDAKKALYTYQGDTIKTAGDNTSGISLAFTYQSGTDLQGKVKSITATSGTTSRTISYAYYRGYTNVSDDSNGVLSYQFNDYGNTVSVQDKTGKALYYKYSDTKANQLDLSSKLTSTPVNLLTNPSFERSGESWQGAAYEGGTGTCGYTSAQKYIGSNSYYLTKTNSVGYMIVGISRSDLKAGKDYTFSIYLKGTPLAYVVVSYGNESVYGDAIQNATDWERCEVTFTAPSSGSVWICVCIIEQGTVYCDAAQLEEGSGAGRYTLIENGDFTYYTGNTATPQQWSQGSGCSANEKRVLLSSGLPGVSNMDSYVYTFTGDTARQRRLYQNIPVSGAKGDTFSLGGWARGNGAPDKSGSYSNNNVFSLVLRFYNYDDSESEYRVDFNTDLYEPGTWQYACERIVAPKRYNSIRILICYEKNINTADFDAISLVKDEFGSSYTYDSDGNVISVKDKRANETSYEYTNNNLTKAILSNGASYKYTYDSYHNVLSAISATGVKSQFTYDTYGNNKTVKIVNPSNSSAAVIQSSANYSSNGNFLTSLTDGAGLTSSYTYNTDTGLLTSSKGPGESAATSYTYDNLHRNTGTAKSLSSLPGGGAATAITYQNDNLKTITHGIGTALTTYTYSYGIFNLPTQVKAGNHTLITKAYDSKQRLASETFGNGDIVTYTYDNYDRLLTKAYDSSDIITYGYDNEDRLAKVKDSTTVTRYAYDISGRLVYEKKDLLIGLPGYYKRTYLYDSYGNLSTVKSFINYEEFNKTYTYDNDYRATGSTDAGVTSTASYDVYGRVASTNVLSSGASKVLTNISYFSPASGYTSILPSAYANNITGNRNVTFNYTYNTKGLISQVNTNGSTPITYEYDDLGRLVRENNGESSFTAVYSYDSAGNITQIKKYAYTTGTPQTLLSTKTLSYGDSSWKDVLTAINGTPVTYDAIGNITSDGTRTYSWTRGRLLDSLTDSTGQYTFAYDADGRRSSISYDGHTLYFFYDGDKLTDLSIDDAGNYMHINYDALGNPVGFNFAGTQFYYVRNLQGDIERIVDVSGTEVVRYYYDAWGTILNITGPGADTIGLLNPLRYRGYIYDTDMGLYYLNSRYYDPEIGRFISPDVYLSTGQGFTGDNMFAYCLDDPVNMKDDDGDIANFVVGAILGAVASLTVTLLFADITNSTVSGTDILLSILSGAAAGLAAASGAPMIIEAIFGGVLGGSTTFVSDYYNGETENIKYDVPLSIIVGFFFGAIGKQGLMNKLAFKNASNSIDDAIANAVRLKTSEAIGEAAKVVVRNTAILFSQGREAAVCIMYCTVTTSTGVSLIRSRKEVQ